MIGRQPWYAFQRAVEEFPPGAGCAGDDAAAGSLELDNLWAGVLKSSRDTIKKNVRIPTAITKNTSIRRAFGEIRREVFMAVNDKLGFKTSLDGIQSQVESQDIHARIAKNTEVR